LVITVGGDIFIPGSLLMAKTSDENRARKVALSLQFYGGGEAGEIKSYHGSTSSGARSSYLLAGGAFLCDYLAAKSDRQVGKLCAGNEMHEAAVQ
jgi:hypothetical protein